MAESSGFFKSINDRKYTVDWLAKYIASFIGNGVYNGELAVTADGSAMSVTLPSGRAWINGYHYRNDGDMTLTIDNADGVLNRVDIVVLRWDVNARSITAQVIKGTPASTAAAPAITRTVEQYDLKLAEISIPAGTTAISQALITDCRLDNSVCGIVTGVLDQVDTTTFYSQIQADLAAFKSGSEADFSTWSEQQKASFDSWFNGIKDILGADEAGNLLNLIEEHKADAVSHVTQSEHDSIASAVQGATIGGEVVPKNDGVLDFPICAQGNAFVWTATNVGEPDTNNSVVLTIPNFVFTEGCQVTFKATSAPSANNAYCCINCGDTWYALRKLDGSVLDGDEWVAGATVTVTLSSQSFNHPENWPTAFFKGGAGAGKEWYDFPLSEQTSAPTPLNNNHLWIHNDTKMPLTIDEAIRASEFGGDNRYFAIVDNTDNNLLYSHSPKTLTDGTHVLVNNRHINKDWNDKYIHISSAFPSGKKNGINFWQDNWIKPPRIYSRINGVVDMEDAQRWNGSEWEWLSQKGHYLIASSQVFNRTDSILTPHSNFLTMQGGVKFSKDGNYVLNHNRAFTIAIYQRIGDSFSQVLKDTWDSSCGQISQAEFSPDGNYVACAMGNYNTRIYKKDVSGNWALLTTLPYKADSLCWNQASNRLCLMAVDTTITLLSRFGDSFTVLNVFSQIDPNRKSGYVSSYDMQWVGSYIAYKQYYNAISILQVNSDVISYKAQFGGFGGIEISSFGGFVLLNSLKIIAVAGTTIYSYDVSSTKSTILFSTQAAEKQLCITPDEKFIFCQQASGTKIDAYSFDGSTVTYLGSTNISNSPGDMAAL